MEPLRAGSTGATLLPPSQLSHKTESFKAAARAEAISIRQAGRQREGGWELKVGEDTQFPLPAHKNSVETEKNLGQTQL